MIYIMYLILPHYMLFCVMKDHVTRKPHGIIHHEIWGGWVRRCPSNADSWHIMYNTRNLIQYIVLYKQNDTS